MLALVGVLLLTLLVVGTASYYLARYAVVDLGAQVLTEASSRIEQNVHKSLEVAESQSTILERLFERGLWDWNDHEGVSRYAYETLTALGDLSYLSLGLETGKYWHVFRDTDGKVSVLWLLPSPSGDRRLLEFHVGANGEREIIRDITPSTRVPPQERPYYIAAREAGHSIWTETYVFLGSGESLDIPGVSRATPLYAAEQKSEAESNANPGDAPQGDRRLIGVLTADFDLHALSRFLRAAPVGKRGFAFIVEERSDGTRRVIAHPDAAHPDPAQRLELTEPSPAGEGRTTVRVEEIADPRVPLLVSLLADSTASPRAELVRIDAPDGRYVGGYRRLQGDGAPPWTICMLVPREEIIGDVQRMARTLLWIAALGVLAVVFLALVLSKRVSDRLNRVVQETGEVARFHLEPRPVVPTRIAEIDRLGFAVEEMKAGLRSFQKYVPADLVRHILESGEEARLGGSRKTITIYFSDIARFTSVSEQLGPEELVELLAEYLEAMTQEMLRAGGTVDKYIGDAIMAFWGAPRPLANHPLIACRTALANQSTLARLREKWTAQGKPALRARIGLHTGEAIVGNFGSESRLDFTAIGDSVNLASRLENLNGYYGTEILISDATCQHVRNEIISRPLDKVAVKGKLRGIVIHELIGLRGEVSREKVDRAEAHSRAFESYLSRDWGPAKAILDEMLRKDPEDVAAALLRERCGLYLEEPPPDDWAGVHRMQTK
jgi:adenylate cyclase